MLCSLAACGGGGSSGAAATTGGNGATGGSSAPPVPGVTTYALQAGFKALTLAGSVDNFKVTGDCNGTAQTTNGSASPAAFEGANGYSTLEIATLSVPDCSTTTTQSSGINYYDANVALLGSVGSSQSYSTVVGSALALPASVKVGDAAPNFLVLTTYTDSTKTVRTGQTLQGYAIEADTASPSASANTAIYHVTSRSYDGTNTLSSVQQIYYRMAIDGTLTLLSLDVQYTGSSSVFAQHLLYSRVN